MPAERSGGTMTADELARVPDDGTLFVDVLEKVRDYLAGTRMVWVIDPEGRSAAVCRPDGLPALMGADGVLDGADEVPGFAVTLRDVLP